MARTLTQPRTALKTHAGIIREDFVRGNDKSLRVDRERGIIFGVKVLGRSSPNTHGVRGVEGTDYTPAAMEKARGLYENKSVNVDHPDRAKPNSDRSSDDRIGWLSNVQVRPDGIFADLNLLKTHPLSDRLFEAGERNPSLFGLSHNAWGKGEVRGSRYVITEIPEVRSVDVVADAGTVTSLFESSKPMSKTLKQLIEACDEDKDGKDAMVKEAEDAGLDAMTPAPAESTETTDWKQHIVDALGKLMQSENPEDHDLAKKLMAVMKPADGDVAAGPTEEGSDELRGKNQDGQMRAIQHKDPEGHGQGHNESRENLKRFKDVTLLCESERFMPTPAQRKALEALTNDKDRKELLKDLKGATRNGPRSSSPHSLHESRETPKAPANFDEFKARTILN